MEKNPFYRRRRVFSPVLFWLFWNLGLLCILLTLAASSGWIFAKLGW